MNFADMGNIQELIKAGGPILILLAILSICSLAVILERFFYLRRQVDMSRKLIIFVKHQIRTGDLSKVIEVCKRENAKNTPAGKVVSAILNSGKRGEALKEVSNVAIDWEITLLHKRLPILATLGSTTPFIGLFGTILGVMHAFADLASVSGAAAGPSVVARGISEALVNTAAGLFVAVPAVMAYNYFTSQINYFERELENISGEVINAL